MAVALELVVNFGSNDGAARAAHDLVASRGGLLAGFAGYRAAQVGWDPEDRGDTAELRKEWGAELADGIMSGLVLAEDVLSDLRGPAFQPFAPGFLWIPCSGEQPSTLTSNERAT